MSVFKELNVVPLGISVDSPAVQKAFYEKLGLKELQMLADFYPHGEVAKKYGIFRKEGHSSRVIIVLDEDGKIIVFQRYLLTEAPNIDNIIDFLKKFKK